MNATYSTGSGRLRARDVPVVRKELESIEEKRGRLDSSELYEELVSRAKPARSPTHHLFEWSDSKAAHQHRLDAARQIVMAVRVVFDDKPDCPVRAFPVVVTDGKRGPYPMELVRKDINLMAAVLETAKAEAVAWRRRWERLRTVSELRNVFRAIDKLKKK